MFVEQEIRELGSPGLFRSPENGKWLIRKMLVVSLYDYAILKVSLHYRYGKKAMIC